MAPLGSACHGDTHKQITSVSGKEQYRSHSDSRSSITSNNNDDAEREWPRLAASSYNYGSSPTVKRVITPFSFVHRVLHLLLLPLHHHYNNHSYYYSNNSYYYYSYVRTCKCVSRPIQ